MQDGYDGLELAEMGYSPSERGSQDQSRCRACSVCNNLPNLMNDNLHRGTSCAMRNLLHNAMESRCQTQCFGVVRVPSLYYDRPRRDLAAIEAGPARLKGGDSRRISEETNANRRKYGAKKFEETSYASVEIRQNTWGFAKRKRELEESTNVERSFASIKRTPMRNIDLRRRGLRGNSYDQDSVQDEKEIINENTSRKKTRFKDDVEILEEENSNKHLQNNTRWKHKTNNNPQKSIDNNIQSSCDINYDFDTGEHVCLNAGPTQKELEDKLLDLYQYILTFRRSKEVKNSRVTPELKAIDHREHVYKRTTKRRKFLLRMASKPKERLPEKGKYRKVEVTKRPEIKLRRQLLKECDGIMQERLNDVVKKILKSKDNDKRPPKVDSNNVDRPSKTPKRKSIEIELSSLYGENKEPVLPAIDETKCTIDNPPSTMENHSHKESVNLSLSSDHSSSETLTFTKDSAWREGEEEQTKTDFNGNNSIEASLGRGLKRCHPVTHFPPGCWGADGHLLRDVLGCSKSLPSSATPSKIVTRKQVRCVLRRSPPGTSIKRIDPRRRHHTQTLSRKVISRAELISHSEHSGHYFSRQDASFPLKNAEKGDKSICSPHPDHSGVFNSLQSESFSSSLRISRLESGMSYQTLGKTDFEEILPPRVHKNHDVNNIAFHDQVEKLVRNSQFSSSDISKSTSSSMLKTIATNKKKNLVLETFRDVLKYIKEKKTPTQLTDTKVPPNSISSSAMKEQRHVKSTGSQVLEAFCDLVRYLREINVATSNMPCSRYLPSENVVKPNPDGDAKEYVRVPIKFDTHRKHSSTQGGSSLVLETFREVLKLMQEEDSVEIMDRRSSKISFSPREQGSYLFFELRNRKLFSDSELHMNVPKCDRSKLSKSSENTGKEDGRTLNEDKPFYSADQARLCTTLPANKKDLRGRTTRDGHKESVVPILRQLFHLPLFDNLKKTIKDSTSRRNRRSTAGSQEVDDNLPSPDIQGNVYVYQNIEEKTASHEQDRNVCKLNKTFEGNVEEIVEKSEKESSKVKTNSTKDSSRFCTNIFHKRYTWPCNFKGDSKEKYHVTNEDSTKSQSEKKSGKARDEPTYLREKEPPPNISSNIPCRMTSSAHECSVSNDLQMAQTTKNDTVKKDPPPKKFQRNVKALEKIASERYCYLRRRADLQKRQEEKD